MNWAKTTARQDEKYLSFWIWCTLYKRSDSRWKSKWWWIHQTWKYCTTETASMLSLEECSPNIQITMIHWRDIMRLLQVSFQCFQEHHNFEVHSCRSYMIMNSSPPSVTYMHQWMRSALVQLRACHLSVAKPLSEPMSVFCQLDP